LNDSHELVLVQTTVRRIDRILKQLIYFSCALFFSKLSKLI
jgi:hypothetical protein